MAGVRSVNRNTGGTRSYLTGIFNWKITLSRKESLSLPIYTINIETREFPCISAVSYT